MSSGASVTVVFVVDVIGAMAVAGAQALMDRLTNRIKIVMDSRVFVFMLILSKPIVWVLLTVSSGVTQNSLRRHVIRSIAFGRAENIETI